MKRRIFAGRAGWITYRRRLALRTHAGLRASVLSNVDDKSTLSPYVSLSRGSSVLASHLGAFSYLAPGAKISVVRMGSFCSIGPEVLAGGLGSHPSHWISTHPAFYSHRADLTRSLSQDAKYDEHRETIIGNDVWIGARAIILDGVHIGNGAIIGAGAVVTRNVAPYAIVGGVPAKVIRMRFPGDIIAQLEALAWWDYPIDNIANAAKYFTSKDSFDDSDLDILRRALNLEI